MRIPGNVYSNAQIATRTDRAAQTQVADGDGKAEGAKKGAMADVSVEVSSQAKKLASVNAMDIAKVERLRAAIAGGTFAIDHGAIAATLIETGG